MINTGSYLYHVQIYYKFIYIEAPYWSYILLYLAVNSTLLNILFGDISGCLVYSAYSLQITQCISPPGLTVKQILISVAKFVSTLARDQLVLF